MAWRGEWHCTYTYVVSQAPIELHAACISWHRAPIRLHFVSNWRLLGEMRSNARNGKTSVKLAKSAFMCLLCDFQLAHMVNCRPCMHAAGNEMKCNMKPGLKGANILSIHHHHYSLLQRPQRRRIDNPPCSVFSLSSPLTPFPSPRHLGPLLGVSTPPSPLPLRYS